MGTICELMKTHSKALTLTAAAAIVATAASPCGFHSYTPQPTMVDRMLGSDHIVLARPASGNPFRFEAVTALEGSLDYVEIPHLVDSATRRKLSLDPTAHVLFSRDDAYGPWIRLAHVDAAMAPVVEGIMARLPEWEIGADADRFGFFGALLGHPDERVHRLALRELDQADYSVLRSLDLDIDVERITGQLNLPSESDLRPIRVLLLGLSGTQDAEEFLKDGVQTYSRSGGGMLGAYATAYIEQAGSTAAENLASGYLADATLPGDSRELIAEALAIQSQSGSEDLRAGIRAAVASTLSDHPQAAPAIARQFGLRYDWSHAGILSDVLRSRALTAPGDVIVVSQYVALAAQDSAQTGN